MQEVFDKVYAYAQTMTKAATDDKGVCRYRSPNGPCLIGILVSDEEAEKADKLNITADNAIKEGVFSTLNPSYAGFCWDIQRAHDYNTGDNNDFLDKEAMLEDLRWVARAYGLNV